MARLQTYATATTTGLIVGSLALVLFTGVLTSSAKEARERSPSPDMANANTKAPRCLDGRNIGAIRVVGENLIIAHDSFGNPYEMELGGPCRSMTDMSHIGFEFNGADSICGAHDAFVLYSEENERPMRCIINSVKSISRAEADKLENH